MNKYRPNDIIGDVMSTDKFTEMFPFLVDEDGTVDPSFHFLTISACALENLKAKNKPFKKHASIEAKLKANSISAAKDKYWPAAEDNLKTKIHPIRYDRFNLLSSEELFKRSAEFYSTNPLPAAISSYDLSNLDLTNKISAKGFEELHNPESQIISIKMFSPENVKKSAGGMSNFNVVHDEGGNPTVLSSLFLDDIQNIKQFQISFFGLFVGKSRATPWDKSLESLWKFFLLCMTGSRIFQILLVITPCWIKELCAQLLLTVYCRIMVQDLDIFKVTCHMLNWILIFAVFVHQILNVIMSRWFPLLTVLILVHLIPDLLLPLDLLL